MNAKKITERDYIKASRRGSRETEIENHSRPISFSRVHKSNKVYDRKKQKADDKRHLPSYFLYGLTMQHIYVITYGRLSLGGGIRFGIIICNGTKTTTINLQS